MDQNQAITILVQVAHQALGAGLFKSFEDAKVVSEAIDAFKQEGQQAEPTEEAPKLKKEA
jgi:hypothetical protein